MSYHNEPVKSRGASKPPPPVPPRPSKTLIMEALAKTRQAHETYLSSVPKDQNHEKLRASLSSAMQNSPEINNRFTSVGCNGTRKQSPADVCKQGRYVQLDTHNARPVIYQSDNCKSRPAAAENDINQTQNISKGSGRLVNESKPRQFISKKVTPPSYQNNYDQISETTTKANEIEGSNGNEKEKNGYTKNVLDEEVSSILSNSSTGSNCSKTTSSSDKNWDSVLSNRNHVNTLIDEMFASVLEVNLSASVSPSSSTESIDNKITIANKSNSEEDNLTIIIVNDEVSSDKISVGDSASETKSTTSTCERKVTFNDRKNHEYLIDELQNMKHQEENILKRQRLSSSDNDVTSHDGHKIQTNDWYGVNEGKKVRMSSCRIKVEDADEEENCNGYQKIRNMSRAYDLPPLPKSLSAFRHMESTEVIGKGEWSNQKPQIERFGSKEAINGDVATEKTPLDTQLAILRREMDSLREQDLSLLSKLWFLNESIQDFRQMLQDQEEKLNPSPTLSSVDDEDFYVISTSNC